MLQQALNRLRMTKESRVAEWCCLLVILRFNVSACFDQHPGNLRVPQNGGDNQRCPASEWFGKLISPPSHISCATSGANSG